MRYYESQSTLECQTRMGQGNGFQARRKRRSQADEFGRWTPMLPNCGKSEREQAGKWMGDPLELPIAPKDR